MGIRKILNLHHHHNHRLSKESPPEVHRTFYPELIQENISSAETIIAKWDPNTPNPNLTALVKDRDETRKFLHTVHELQIAINSLTSPNCIEAPNLRAGLLARATSLMQCAMRRLEREFYQILASNREELDLEVATTSGPNSGDDVPTVCRTIVRAEWASADAGPDLRSIAQAMIQAGCKKQCVRMYKLVRKSIVDEALFRLGFEYPTLSQLNRLEWWVLDNKIQIWLAGCGVAVRTLFAGERVLCDRVFGGSDPISESCFAGIAGGAAAGVLDFAETVARSKTAPEKLFRILDMYGSLSGLVADLESVFSSESTSAVRSKARSSLAKLAESARSTMSEFESAIRRDGSKADGRVHPLTRYAANYLVFLADYEGVVADVESSGNRSARFRRLVDVIVCKVEEKARNCRESAVSDEFLARNVEYVVEKVNASRLRILVGEDWAEKYSAGVRNNSARSISAGC